MTVFVLSLSPHVGRDCVPDSHSESWLWLQVKIVCVVQALVQRPFEVNKVRNMDKVQEDQLGLDGGADFDDDWDGDVKQHQSQEKSAQPPPATASPIGLAHVSALLHWAPCCLWTQEELQFRLLLRQRPGPLPHPRKKTADQARTLGAGVGRRPEV